MISSFAKRVATPRLLTSSLRLSSTFSASELTITPTSSPKTKLPKEELSFGNTFSDHMLEIDWTMEDGWGKPRISEYGNLSLSPASTGLHYGETRRQGCTVAIW